MKLKLLMDENLGFKTWRKIESLGYDAKSVLGIERGLSDVEVIKIANHEGRIIFTLDKDFGFLARKYSPPGVVILRLRNQGVRARVMVMKTLLEKHSDQLEGKLVIVSESGIRIRPIQWRGCCLMECCGWGRLYLRRQNLEGLQTQRA